MADPGRHPKLRWLRADWKAEFEFQRVPQATHPIRVHLRLEAEDPQGEDGFVRPVVLTDLPGREIPWPPPEQVIIKVPMEHLNRALDRMKRK